MAEELATGKLARAGTLGKAAARIAAGEMGHRLKRPFLSTEAQQADRAALDNANARRLFEALSQLRGTATKLGQMLGMELGVLPPAYQRELEKSFYRVPPLSRPLVRKVVEGDWGIAPEAAFLGFDYEAFAAASIGQVHHAMLTDGRKVVVKVQYPGVREAMASDIALLRNLSRPLPEGPLLRAALDEIEARLAEEVDFRIEAENTRLLRSLITTPHVEIPQVISPFSTERVLTTTLLGGQHLDRWLESDPPQDIRDRAAQALYDVFVECVRVHGVAHVDPNPGNILFREDGSIGLLDFGCVKRFPPHFRKAMPRLLAAHVAIDKEQAFAAYAELGVPADRLTDDLYERFTRPFGEWSAEPLRHARFDFGMGDYSARGMPFLQDLMRQDSFAGAAPDFVFFNRTIYGLTKIFERLGARVAIRDRWLEPVSAG